MSGQSNDAIDLIAQDMKALVKKIQDLRHIGIEDSKIALPKICVIGDQSTGKSSLIEGMSEIKVPRSAGTCTRCPMEINLSESERGQPWTCRVFLSGKYMFDPSHRLTKIPKKSQPLGPWSPQDQEDLLFIELSNKNDVQEAIKWAQIAILNPGHNPMDYIPGKNADATMDCQVKFSPNVVRLDISAPNFPNLSFYDLPGVISQAEFEDERYLVALVENLVRQYISQENCIVIQTLPMTDDATNSSAGRIMRDVRGATERTLGVLTKPDRVQSCESYNQWIEILEGDKFTLGHGYFVVQNNPDPSVGHAQAREEEAAFFASSPWSTELAAYRDRFGTRNLQTRLSMLLLEQIQGCLPRVIEQINAKADRIDAELKTLPDPPSANVQYILCRNINQFKERITAHFDGGSSQYPLQKRWGHMALDFQRALMKTRPTVQLLSQSDRVLERDGDSDCEMTSVQVPMKRKAPATNGFTRSAPHSPRDVKPSVESQPSGYHFPEFEKFDKPLQTFTWEGIREINEESYRAGIPDQADPKAIEIMRQKSVIHWIDPMNVFIQSTHRLVGDMILDQLAEVFSQYYQTSLYKELVYIIDNFLKELKEEHERHAKENYNIEYNKPFTMATVTLDHAIKNAFGYLSARRTEARISYYLDKHNIGPDHPRRDAERKRLTAAEIGPERFEQELKMMASTRGYYDIASSRFLDCTCQSVHTKLFSKCREELIPVIEENLGIQDDNAMERCQELMAEHPERQRRRYHLQRERNKITQAQEWLETAKKEEQSDGVYDFGSRVKTEPMNDWMTRPSFV
ncbi:Dynamin family protein [Aspergillus steynii IBT 23096]|uniref:Dynamin family protein n=1 Tax=Aspergillus steynii IBT 23096 TaxID=1392250 RepID=A0A2I2GRL3_9EURO|nr:Dynamin family protein [Aspergillus steynii IBT 23096]PLB55520.1 Dynamin family protein [Aspergillus steynii IBT 23096]